MNISHFKEIYFYQLEITFKQCIPGKKINVCSFCVYADEFSATENIILKILYNNAMYPWSDSRVLFQRHSCDEPKTVGYGETTLAVILLGVWPPFVWRESSQEKERKTHRHIGQ